ncbi:MAG TPA: creatininase family protein [Vicinamibacterales bacterium]|nr:creatininase family protein [Vicinamibacterales bacterium]
MKLTTALAFALLFVAASGAAQPPQPAQGQNRPPLTAEQQAAQQARQAASAPDAVRPIDMLDTVWIEEQTWMETRDAIKAGKTTAIIGTGGNEQNGPYNANGKHNYVLRATCEATARKLGNALCGPIVTLEPGNPERPGLTPGSVFITEATFRAVLTDMSTSLKSMGFTDIVMIGDSGGNINGMKESAAALNAKWAGISARVHFVPEYYEEDKWSYQFLKTLGIHQTPDVQSATRYDIHDDYHYEALVALIDPMLIRPEQRMKAKKFSINGVDIGSVAKMIKNGKKIQEHRATITANAIRKALAAPRASSRQ